MDSLRGRDRLQGSERRTRAQCLLASSARASGTHGHCCCGIGPCALPALSSSESDQQKSRNGACNDQGHRSA